MALLGITCFNTFIYQAGHTTDATNMSLLATASPIVMAADVYKRQLSGPRNVSFCVYIMDM